MPSEHLREAIEAHRAFFDFARVITTLFALLALLGLIGARLTAEKHPLLAVTGVLGLVYLALLILVLLYRSYDLVRAAMRDELARLNIKSAPLARAVQVVAFLLGIAGVVGLAGLAFGSLYALLPTGTSALCPLICG